MVGLLSEATLSSLRPGMVILVYYDDDRMWHERLLLYPVTRYIWVILTPDDDFYEEQISGGAADGASRASLLEEDFSVPAHIVEPVYRFTSYPARDELRKLIKQARADAHSLVAEADKLDMQTVINPLGVSEPINDFMEEEFVRPRGRIWGKKGDSSSAVVAVDTPHGGPTSGKGAADSPTQGGAVVLPSAVTRPQPPPDGSVWVAAEPEANLKLGQEMTLGSKDFCVGSDTAMCLRGDVWVKAVLVKVEDAPGYAAARRALFEKVEALAADEGNADLKRRFSGRSDEVAAEKKDGDLRTLAVDFDGHGERYKSWRDVTKEILGHEFKDWLLETPPAIIHLCKHMERKGGSPMAWLEKWCRAKDIKETDRVYYELQTLCEILETAGCYDQLNLGSLVSMELCGLRLQTIIDAYETNPKQPSFDHAKYFSGMPSSSDAVSPSLRSFAAKKARDEAEIEKQRQKVRELRKEKK